MVYTSTEVYMVQDSSHEFENTWNFLDRQLACYVWLGQCTHEVRIAYAGAWILACFCVLLILISYCCMINF